RRTSTPPSRAPAASPSADGATATTWTPSARSPTASRSRNPPVRSPTARGKAWARNTTRSGLGSATVGPVGAISKFDQGVGQGGPEPGRELVAEAGDPQQPGPADCRGGCLAPPVPQVPGLPP